MLRSALSDQLRDVLRRAQAATDAVCPMWTKVLLGPVREFERVDLLSFDDEATWVIDGFVHLSRGWSKNAPAGMLNKYGKLAYPPDDDQMSAQPIVVSYLASLIECGIAKAGISANLDLVLVKPTARKSRSAEQLAHSPSFLEWERREQMLRREDIQRRADLYCNECQADFRLVFEWPDQEADKVRVRVVPRPASETRSASESVTPEHVVECLKQRVCPNTKIEVSS